jgi:hypothetical protein
MIARTMADYLDVRTRMTGNGDLTNTSRDRPIAEKFGRRFGYGMMHNVMISEISIIRAEPCDNSRRWRRLRQRNLA